jgi:hypothetical protein
MIRANQHRQVLIREIAALGIQPQVEQTPGGHWPPTPNEDRWLGVYCAGCRQVKPIDIASIDIHPQACLTGLILLLRCRQCGGHGPLPNLIGLSRVPPATAAALGTTWRLKWLTKTRETRLPE